MKSTELIHNIIDHHGHYTRNADFMRELKALRTQVKREVLSKVKNSIGLINLMYK